MRWTFSEVGRLTPFEGILPLAALKADLDVHHNDDDTLITAHRDAAIRWVENYTNLRLGLSRLRFISDRVGAGGVTLPFGPVVSVEALRVAGMAIGGFRSIYGDPHTLLPPAGHGWPSYNMEVGAVEVDYTAGFAPGQADPLALQGVKAVAAIYYDKPARIEEELKGAEALLFNLRRRGLA